MRDVDAKVKTKEGGTFPSVGWIWGERCRGYIHIYTWESGEAIFFPVAIYYSKRLLLLPSTLCHHYYAVLFLILPVPTRVFFAVVCGDQAFFTLFWFRFGESRHVCLSTLVLSHSPCYSSLAPRLPASFNWTFLSYHVLTVAALSSAGSVIGSFHRCTRARVCPSISQHKHFTWKLCSSVAGVSCVAFLGLCWRRQRRDEWMSYRQRALLLRDAAAGDSFHETNVVWRRAACGDERLE